MTLGDSSPVDISNKLMPKFMQDCKRSSQVLVTKTKAGQEKHAVSFPWRSSAVSSLFCLSQYHSVA